MSMRPNLFSRFARMARFAALGLTIGSLVVGTLLMGGARAEHNELASPDQTELERTIHQYLLDHPEVVVEVLEILRERQRLAEEERVRAALAAHRNELVNDPATPVAGNPVGDVTLVEFFDYQCAYCKRSLDAVVAMLGEDPGLRIVYKEFPILGPESVIAARAALASRKQDAGKYLEFHVALMSTRGRLTQPRILEIAADTGFDTERLVADMSSPEIEAVIERNLALARSLEINGTPTFVIGDRLIPGAVDLDTLRKLIAEARAS